LLRVTLSVAVVSTGPRKPGAVHFDTKHYDHWMTKIPRGVGPLVDVGVPLACEYLGQAKLVRPAIFLVRLVPWRPKNQWQRAVSPDHIEIIHGEILFSPITRRSDDPLMFSHHLLEVLDRLQRPVVFC